MKYPIRVLLSLLTLCTIGLGTNNVSAESNQCREIRAVRRLAIRENLDRDNLATLESKYCGHSNLPSSSIESRLNSSEDCFNLTVMAELASMTEEGRNFVGTIKSLRQVPCKLPRQGQRSYLEWPNTLYWPNGKTVKWASEWYYPNGQKAKWASEWYYPNGQVVKYESSYWNYYPNGQTARSGSNWYTPKGQSTSVDSLLTQGCSIVSTTECDRILTEINRFDQNPSDENPRNDLLRHLGIVKLSWLSYQQTNQSK